MQLPWYCHDRNKNLFPHQNSSSTDLFNQHGEKVKVLNHLRHLFLDRISLGQKTTNENCMVFKVGNENLFAFLQQGMWKSSSFDLQTSIRSFHTWKGALETPHLLNSVLIQGDQIQRDTPFIGVTFDLLVNKPENQSCIRKFKAF